MSDSLRNVSGTAFWIAQNRALETASRFPLFRDPWAAELAGERGKAALREVGQNKRHLWVIATRTALLDQLVVEGVAEHRFDTVLNLGAGLDTRAFRLKLPKELRWFDVDKAEIIEYKRDVLADATPRCSYHAIKADLSQDDVRAETLALVSADADRMLVVTEGLLEYLQPEAVQTLASELYTLPASHTWLCNLLSSTVLKRIRKVTKALADVDAPILFAPDESEAFFAPTGWKQVELVSMVERALAYGRMPSFYRPSFSFLSRYAPAELRDRYLGMMNIARLERSDFQTSSPAT